MRSSQQERVVETSRLKVDQLKGTTFINNYVIIKDIGHGVNGRVKLVLDLHEFRLCAMKVLSKERHRQQQLLVMRGRGGSRLAAMGNQQWDARPDDIEREIVVMKKLEHPNVVNLIEVIDDPSTHKLLMVMEYVDGGTLLPGHRQPLERRLDENTARRYFQSILRGVDYLHFNQVVHGDLKADNLLLTSGGQVKITDFGCARLVEPGQYLAHTTGTPAYMAPEVCSDQPYDGFQADVWALGVCLYEMLTGRPPFAAPSVYALYDAIRTQPLSLPTDVGLSKDVRGLLQGMLDKRPDKRWGLQKVRAHRWVSEKQSRPPYGGGRKRRVSVYDRDLQTAFSYVKVPSQTPTMARLMSAVNFEQLEYSEGEYIIREGEAVLGLYLLEAGTVAVWSSTGEEEQGHDHDFGEESSTESDSPAHSRSGEQQAPRKSATGREASPKKPRRRRTERTQTKLQAMWRSRTATQRQLLQRAFTNASQNIRQEGPLDKEPHDTRMYLGPGKLLGDFQPGQDKVAAENVMATTPVKVRLAKKVRVEEMMQAHPEIKDDVASVLAQSRRDRLMLRVYSKLASFQRDLAVVSQIPDVPNLQTGVG